MKNKWVLDIAMSLVVSFFVFMGAVMTAFSGHVDIMHPTFAFFFGLVVYVIGVFFTLVWVVTIKDMVFVWHTRTPPSWGVVLSDMLMASALLSMVAGGYLIYTDNGVWRQFGIFLGMCAADLFIALLFWFGYVREYRAIKKLCGG